MNLFHGSDWTFGPGPLLVQTGQNPQSYREQLATVYQGCSARLNADKAFPNPRFGRTTLEGLGVQIYLGSALKLSSGLRRVSWVLLQTA